MDGFSLYRAYCNLQLPSRPVSLLTLRNHLRSPRDLTTHYYLTTCQTRVGRPPVFFRVGAARRSLPSANSPLDPSRRARQ